MKVRLPLMIQDPVGTEMKGLPDLVEFHTFTNEPFFLSGPVTERVAILDFDEESGTLRPGVPFVEPNEDSPGTYQVEVPDPGDVPQPDFIAVNVLATILRTLEIAEDEAILGRKLGWAFDAPQLLVIPRAGEWPNAFYQRGTHSLQLFYFTPQDGRTVYTALSRDIVAHETAHAILDGIAPDLYNALTPQSLALHEAFADLTAALMAMDSRKLVEKVLEQTGGALHEYTTAFNRIAEEFGAARFRRHSLRDLHERVTMDTVDTVEPHALSRVLSSTLYNTFVETFEERRRRLIEEEGQRFDDPAFSLSGKALWLAARQFSRMIFRALDYLPPGEISFRDYGRAIIAADAVAFPDAEANAYRNFLRQAFRDRGITAGRDDLDTRVDFRFELSRPIDLDGLVESDWVAYDFANRPEVRRLLGIPREVEAFRVHPRLSTVKQFTSARRPQHDIVFKVSWDHLEENDVGHGLPGRRRVRAGTTLVINAEASEAATLQPEEEVLSVRQVPAGKSSLPPYEKGQVRLRYGQSGKNALHVRACLSSDLGQVGERDAMIRHLLQEGLLQVRDSSADGGLQPTAVDAYIRNDVLSVARTARMLHITVP